MVNLRKPPYQPGDTFTGLVNGGGNGTCLALGAVATCAWDGRLESWRVTGVMDDNTQRTYLWVNDQGESDYCSPGPLGFCDANGGGWHTITCPHVRTPL